MHLAHLEICDFRNLQAVGLEPSPGVNLITGQNASGKTSLLESLYFLCHLRSFRTPHVCDLIRKSQPQLELHARFTEGELSHPVGIRRGRRQLEVRADRQPVRRVVDLASRFPVQAIHPDSYRLVTGGPSIRRQFLDWGVFHVEQGFFETWQRYRRALSQRNAALKSRQNDRYCTLWDGDISSTATSIDALRRQYLQQLQPDLETLAGQLFPGQSLDLHYRRGWSEEQPLDQLLVKELSQDRSKGYTRHGPHRAELVIELDGQSAQHGISRGQQKVLVALLRLAQVLCFSRRSQRNCILLYDDLAAELDARHREVILSVLASMPVQLFMTAIDAGQIPLDTWSSKKMFHVERGNLKELI